MLWRPTRPSSASFSSGTNPVPQSCTARVSREEPDPHSNPIRTGMFAHIGQRLLHHTIGGRLQGLIETPPSDIVQEIGLLPAGARLLLRNQLLERARQSQIVQR